MDMVTDKLIEPGVIGWAEGLGWIWTSCLGGMIYSADPRNPMRNSIKWKIDKERKPGHSAPSILKVLPEVFTNVDDVNCLWKKSSHKKRDKRASITCCITHVDGKLADYKL